LATFKAIRIDKAEKGTTAALVQFDEADLMDGDVTVRVEWSTLNYKDGLAVTGEAPVVRRYGGEIVLLPHTSHSTSRIVAAGRVSAEPTRP